jgi:hypothetical protein
MDPHRSFDVLSELLERYESRDRSVECVETRTDEGGAPLHATVDVTAPLGSTADEGTNAALVPEAATLTDDGGLEVTFPAVPLPDLATPATVSATGRAARVVDGTVVLIVELTIAPADEGTSASPDSPAVRDESLPPYEDTAYLEWLYDSCDTFDEMSRRIEMDVSAETVRRYTIEAGVHDPTSYETSADEESTATADVAETETDTKTTAPSSESEAPEAEDPIESIPDEQLLTDGLGLPADLTIEDVADAVVNSVTVYEVHRQLGLGQERTRKLLKRLHLIDLVLHQMNGEPERGTTYEEVAARIRQFAPEETRRSAAGT